jgi:hypothetical protein
MTDDQMFEARDFPHIYERRTCDACPQQAEVCIVATRWDGESILVYMCHGHMLDPGPLLDFTAANSWPTATDPNE